MVVALTVASGCVDRTVEPDPLRFAGSASSLNELGERVLSALPVRDTATLEGFRLTEREHNEVVWPELPASASEVNFPVDFAWTNIALRNQRGLERLQAAFDGAHPRFQGVECRGETQVFETFEVMTDCWIHFTLPDPERTFEVQAFKDVLVRGGGYKIFRYYDEPPRSKEG